MTQQVLDSTPDQDLDSVATPEAVLDAIQDLILVKGDRSRLLWANRAFLEYYGMTNEELRGIVDATHSDQDDTVQYVKDDHQVFTTGQPIQVVEPVTDSAGVVAYFDTIKTAIRNESNEIVGTVGVSRPADEERAAASAAQRSARKGALHDLRALVTHIPLAVAMLDVKKRVVARSRAWDDLFGAPPKENPFYDVSYGSTLPLSEELDRAISRGDRFDEQGMVMRAASGVGMVVADVHGQPFQLPSGETGGVVVLIHDVTDQRRNADEMERMNDELSQFNYRVSHDIVGPLRTIWGLLDVFRSRIPAGDDEVVDEIIDRIGRSVSQLNKLVGDVVDLARADQKEQPKVDVNLEEVVQEVLALHEHSLDELNVSVELDLECKTFWSERTRVSQCLENLISNALKYHDPNAENRRIQIRSRSRTRTVEILVSDNGIGIREDMADKVFDQFFRGSSKHPGSGLGLYLVKKHVLRLSGSVQVLSPGDPTTFRITLPRGGQP